MDKLFRIIFLLISVSFVQSLEQARYDNYRVYKITVDNSEHIQLLKAIEDYPDGYHFMSNIPMKIGSEVDLIVPPHKFGEFSELQEKFGLKTEILTENLQNQIDKQSYRQNRRKAVLDWSSYWTLDEIYEWMDLLLAQYPTAVSSFSVGTSYEGRDIRGLKVNFGNGQNKKSIFVEATIHATEWITTTTATYFLNEILSSNDPDVRELANRFEWYFLPVFNVDGYVFTWTSDRFWRKSRAPTKNLLCKGSDMNRNWDARFNEFATSQNPCNSRYGGDHVFSEVETQQLAKFMGTIPRLNGYFSFHSLGQWLMTPKAYTTEPMDNSDILLEIAMKAGEVLRAKHGTNYVVGPLTQFFGQISGTSVDWVIDNFKPNITFSYELRPTRADDIDGFGMVLPPEQIIPVGEEIFASIVTILKESILKGIA